MGFTGVDDPYEPPAQAGADVRRLEALGGRGSGLVLNYLTERKLIA